MIKHKNAKLQNFANLITLIIGMFFAIFYLELFANYSTFEKILITIFSTLLLYFIVLVPLAKLNNKND